MSSDGESSRGLKTIFAVVGGVMVLGIAAFLIVARGQDLANSSGFFGTRATLFADINLAAQIILLAGLSVGFGLARTSNISAHQYNQTMWVFVNLALTIFIMAVSFNQQVTPGIPEKLLRAYYGTSTIHAALGTITILSALVIVFRMNFPRVFMSERTVVNAEGKSETVAINHYPKSIWKNQMRVTLGLYWLVGLFGLGTYYYWYISETSGGPDVAAAEGQVVVPMANFAFNPFELEVPLGTTVVFVNQDEAPHTVTFDNSEFAETYYEQGAVAEITFDQPGEYWYFCVFHGSPGGNNMAGVIRVGGAAVAAVPTPITPPKPTAQPTPAPVSDAEIETALAEQLVTTPAVGFGVFRDVAGHNDGFDLSVTGLAAPAEGNLHVWLLGAEAALDLGAITPDGSGAATFTYVDPTGANLLATYDQFILARGGVDVRTALESEDVPVRGGIAAGAADPIRQLLVASDDAPDNHPYAIAIIRQAEENLRHVQAVVGAALAGDFASLNRHAEHSFTIVEGVGGPNYRDFDGDGGIVDPGDGFGILNYADALAAHAEAAAAAPGATPTLQANAALLLEVAANIRAWGGQIVQLGIEAHRATAAADQIAAAEEMLLLSERLLNGVDANGDGVIAAVSGEGGVFQAYQQAQRMAALTSTR